MGVAQGEDGAVAARRARQGSVARRERRFLLAVNDFAGSWTRRERDAPVARHRRARRRGESPHRRPRTKRKSQRGVLADLDARRPDGARVSVARAVRSRTGSRIRRDGRFRSSRGSSRGLDGLGRSETRDGGRAAPSDRARPERVGGHRVRAADARAGAATRSRGARTSRRARAPRGDRRRALPQAVPAAPRGRERAVSRDRRGRARRARARHRGVPGGGRARRRAGPAPVRGARAARKARARRRRRRRRR
jgi:hypothetical protein